MSTTISGSANITSLNSKIVANLCSGYFEVDVTPSVFLPGGVGTSGGVQGASVKITNPLGVVIHNYITSGFDIYPPMTSIFSYAIPTIANNYQYGTYTIDVRLTDEDGTTYVVTKTVNICPPDSTNKNKKEGCLNYSITANCKDGKVVMVLAQPPNYKSTAFTSQVVAAILQYPTTSGLPDLNTAYPSFSVKLYEGQYIITGSTCVLYDNGDNVFFKIKYKIDCSKIVACVIDMCCVQAKFDELNAKLKSDCTQDEKDDTMSTILLSQFYIRAAEGAADCGTDPSDYVAELEKLLGCVCTCNCNEGSAIIDSTPASDIVIQGCNVVKNTVGLTTVYDMPLYDYELVNDDLLEILSLTDVDTTDCTKKQHINISIQRIKVLLNIPPAGGVDWIYKAVLNQSGTSIPTATIDTRNGVTVTWTRSGVGSYVGTLSGTFTALTATNLFVLTGKTANILTKVNYLSANSFSLLSADQATAVPADTIIANMPFVLSILA